MEFLVRGATDYDEPGVFMAFEETAAELTQNVRSLGFDLDELVEQRKLAIDFVRVERSEIDETGDYDLEGLFIRLGAAIDSVGAKRVVLGAMENLFSGLQNEGILRAELRRLFRWLKDRGVTAVITAERGEGALTRHGLEEYVSDCVILLDHRVTDQISTRPAHRQISGDGAWYQRISLPDRRRWLQRSAGHLPWAATSGERGTRLEWDCAPGFDAGWQRILPRQHGFGLGNGRNR
jgi:KaiC/GvpD/RAD55 family RecA-like ATPase